MNPITDKIQRWWQEKGFGIQSKTDYAFLHDVLTEKHRYYAYDTLRNAYPAAVSADRQCAKLLFRICNHAKGEPITLAGSYSDIERHAVRLAAEANSTFLPTLNHLHNLNIVVVKGIDRDLRELWQQICSKETITYDMEHIGIAFFNKNRYPEHYKILKP